MNKHQWAALYTFCEESLYSKWGVLRMLKENGVVDKDTTFDNLGEYVDGDTYDDMMKFLEENL